MPLITRKEANKKIRREKKSCYRVCNGNQIWWHYVWTGCTLCNHLKTSVADVNQFQYYIKRTAETICVCYVYWILVFTQKKVKN